MEKRWILKPVPPLNKVEKLSQEVNINPLLASILIQRNIFNFQEAKEYFRPDLRHLHDPFLMKGMDAAVARIRSSFANKEKVLIYGDYDVDGTTSVAMVYHFFKKAGLSCAYYIPDRYKEGYGISYKGIDFAHDNGCTLIISLDCGIKAVDHVAYAKKSGIDFIICDHHQPGDTLPDACAVLDPKQNGCNYPYKELSGCGVGFKLLQAFCMKEGIGFDDLYPYLDLLVTSIASDIVPITGENRIFAHFGLKVLNECPRLGIKALIDVSGYKSDLDITNVVFGLGPRINAAGRIAHANAAVDLLLTENVEEAGKYAKEINEKNSLRKDFDSSITEEAIRMIEEDICLKDAKTTVLYKDDWHKGVIGIVASRCIERYHRPTIILTKSENRATGSARSVTGFDVYAAIDKCADLLEQYGGHKYAAGLTLKLENIEEFRRRFEEVVSDDITTEQLIPHVEIDLELDLKQITGKFYNILKQMSPFGPGNMQPVFVSKNVCDDGRARLLKDQHLKLCIRQDSQIVYEAIGFGMPQYYERIKNGEYFNICYNICENDFNGVKSLQLLIKDIKFTN